MSFNPCVVTFTSHMDEPGLHRLMRTCHRTGWDIHVVNSPFQGWGYRLKKVLGKREELLASGYTHLVHVDAFDVISQGEPHEIEWKLKKYGDPHLLIAAEHGCWPDGDKRELFGPMQSHWWFPHSQYIIDIRKEIPRELIEVSDIEDDQRHLSNLVLAGHDWIKMDRECLIFQSFAFCHPYENFFEKSHNKWRNKLTGSFPIFFHGNGRTNGDWLWAAM